MKEIKKMSLSNAVIYLTKDEQKNILAGTGGGIHQYCQFTCKNTGAIVSSSNTTYDKACAYADSYCGMGAYSMICVG